MAYLKNLQITICFLFVYTSLAAQLKPGDINPNAKYIDADELKDFIQGVAIIKKGSSYALIDTNGNYIVPYNKYYFHSDVKDSLIIISEGKAEYEPPYGVININGKKLYSSPHSITRIEDGYASIPVSGANNFLFVNAKGEIIKSTLSEKFNNGF